MNTNAPTRRELLAALLAAGAAPAFVRHAQAADLPRFALGVASGHPRPDGMVLWTRLMGADLPARVEVQWELALDEAFTRVEARGTEVAEAAWAHSVHAEPAGLDPGRVYWYRFSALGQRSAVGRTRTAPAPEADSPRLRFAIASCQRWDTGHWAAWRDVAESDLDLVLFLGDYIYESASPRDALRRHRRGLLQTLDDYRDRYAQYKEDPLLQAAHAAAPWLVIWDDHEVANDYAGAHPGSREYADFAALRRAAVQAWWEHQPLPKAVRPSDGALRVYGHLDWGRQARFLLLDDRQHRDPQVCPPEGRGGSNTVRVRECPALLDPSRSLLGAAQERWLADHWSLQHRWNLVAQQTLMARMTWEDPAVGGGRYWTDGWDGYPAARQRLLGSAAARRTPGVVVLGGDVHANYVADLRADFDDERSPVVASEFCGTSISSRGLAQARLDAALPLNPHIHWGRSDQRGTVRFELQRHDLSAELRVVDDPADPASPVQTAARFRVDARRPGVVRG